MTKETLDLIEKLIQVHRDGLDSEGGGCSTDGWESGHIWYNGRDGSSGWASGRGLKRSNESWEWRARDDENVPGLDTLLSELVAFARSKL